MSKNYKPAGCPSMMTYMMVADCSKALDFYEKAFNFKRDPDEMVEEEGRVVHAAMNYDDSRFMMGDEKKWPDLSTATPKHSGHKSPIGFYIYCKDVDKMFEQAKSAGAVALAEPEDTFWGDRMCRLRCPDGYEWSLATATQS